MAKMPPHVIFIVALNKDLERVLGMTLRACAEHSSEICVFDVESLAKRLQVCPAGPLQTIATLAQSKKDMRQSVSGWNIVDMASHTLETMILAHPVRTAFIFGTPHTPEQAERLFSWKSSSQLFFIGNGIDSFSPDPYQNRMTTAARKFKECGGVVHSVNQSRSHHDIIGTILAHSRVPYPIKLRMKRKYRGQDIPFVAALKLEEMTAQPRPVISV